MRIPSFLKNILDSLAREYLKANGFYCPLCETGDVEIIRKTGKCYPLGFQEVIVKCNECGKEYIADYL